MIRIRSHTDAEAAGRFATLASLIPRGSRVADIGSGHGLLAHRLLRSGRCRRCIVTERTAGLLSRIRRYPASHPFAGALELRWGDGLSALDPGDEVDTVVIAGLGGLSIAGMLAAARDRLRGVKRLVLQPQTDHAELRRRLAVLGLALVEERLIYERGRFYVVLAAEPCGEVRPPSHPTLQPGDLFEAGPCLVRDRDPLLIPYWRRQLDRLERILERNPGGAARDEIRRRAESARRILRAIGAKTRSAS